MSDIAIRVTELTKHYNLYSKPADRVKEAFSFRKKAYHQVFRALESVSLEIHKGETFGILGGNGAGKSTLLKIVTGVLTPTSGAVEVNGRISALLELGTGFNHELNGLENIRFNGALLGFSRTEMEQKIEAIVAFADIGEFIHQPVKTYSSGMFMRLAFAVAINVDPDILIIDEALSVGDMFFQAKCFQKFADFKAQGKTIVFVTHSLDLILRFCDRSAYLSSGKLKYLGSSRIAVDEFKKEGSTRVAPPTPTADGKNPLMLMKQAFRSNPDFLEYGNLEAEIVDYGLYSESQILSSELESGKPFRVVVIVRANVPLSGLVVAFTFKNPNGEEIFGTNTHYEGVNLRDLVPGELRRFEFEQKMILNTGPYLVSLGCTSFKGEDLIVHHRLYDIMGVQIYTKVPHVGICRADSVVRIGTVDHE